MRTSLAVVLAMLAALALAAPALAADPLRPQQWGLDMIEADAAHATSTGTGAVVAVIDTGVLPSHEDLSTQLVPGFDFAAEPDDSIPDDGDGHGTHVSGIVAAASGNGKGVESVAPGAKVMPIRVLGDDGSGTTTDVAKGIDYAVAHKADVINLSLGGDASVVLLGDDPAYVAAVDRAVKAGVVVVAAAGNDSLPVCEQPQSEGGKILCVGAVDKRGDRSFFSSSGNIVAPGGSAQPFANEDILSTYNDGKYTEIAGTSQATPHVAGVAALLVSLGVRGQAAVDRILATAKDAGAAGPDSSYGNGILNARAAVDGLKPPAGGGGAPGPGGGGSGGGGTVTVGGKTGISYRRVQRISTVLRRGLRVRCRAAKAGTCRVRVVRKGKLLAARTRSVPADKAVTLNAPVTKSGRRTLRAAKRLKVTLAVKVGGKSFRRTVTLVR